MTQHEFIRGKEKMAARQRSSCCLRGETRGVTSKFHTVHKCVYGKSEQHSTSRGLCPVLCEARTGHFVFKGHLSHPALDAEHPHSWKVFGLKQKSKWSEKGQDSGGFFPSCAHCSWSSSPAALGWNTSFPKENLCSGSVTLLLVQLK